MGRRRLYGRDYKDMERCDRGAVARAGGASVLGSLHGFLTRWQMAGRREFWRLDIDLGPAPPRPPWALTSQREQGIAGALHRCLPQPARLPFRRRRTPCGGAEIG